MTLILSLLLAATITSTEVITSKDDVRRVEPAELHELMKKGEAVALDVRGTVPYRHGHIAGAVWMPLGHLHQRAGELPEDKLLVAYCTCKSEETSLEAAMKLSELGFKNVAVLLGGYPMWADAGLPVESLVQRDGHPSTVPGTSPSSGSGSAGRLAPPEAVKCDRNKLTSYAGRPKTFARRGDVYLLTIATSAGTTETVSVPADLASFLIEGKRFTEADWKRIQTAEGTLRSDLSVIAWVCSDGPDLVDWRPGVTFDGGE